MILRTCVLALVFICPARAADLTRVQVLETLQVWSAAAPAAGEARPTLPAGEAAARQPILDAVARLGSERKDPELTAALVNYQVSFLSPETDAPARAMGRIFLEQPDTLLKTLDTLPAAQRVAVWPYVLFGWEQAIRDKNRSLPRIVDRQKRLEAYGAHLMNARPGAREK